MTKETPEKKQKRAKQPYYIDAQGNRRDPNRVGDPKLCSAHSKRTGKLCGNLAMPNGKCRVHGGASTGPKTKEGKARVGEATARRRLKTGEFAPIWYDTLTPDEQDYLNSGPIPSDAKSLLEEQLIFVTIRERRMMKMIMELEDSDFDEVVQETWKRRLVKDKDDKPIVEIDEEGHASKLAIMQKDMVIVNKEDMKKRIQEIEDALTRVQQQKFKLIDLKAKLEQDEIKEEDGSLTQLVGIIATARNLRNEQTAKMEAAQQ